MPAANVPSIFLTHHKCASTWLVQILERYGATFGRSLFRTHLSGFRPPQEEHFDLLLFTNSDYDYCTRNFQPWLDAAPLPALHVIRNPLDLVVSAYYSHLSSHPLDTWPELARQRDVLRRLDKTAGMLATWVFLERSDFYDGAVGPLYALRRWNFNDPRIKTLRMEELVDDQRLVRSELQSRLGADPAEIVAHLTFEKLSGGRARGVVDDHHHFRSGKPQQWREEMDTSLAHAVYREYQAIVDRFYPDVEQMLRAKEA